MNTITLTSLGPDPIEALLARSAKQWGIPLAKWKAAVHWELQQQPLTAQQVPQLVAHAPDILRRYDAHLLHQQIQQDLQLRGMIEPHVPAEYPDRELVIRKLIAQLRERPTVQRLQSLLLATIHPALEEA